MKNFIIKIINWYLPDFYVEKPKKVINTNNDNQVLSAIKPTKIVQDSPNFNDKKSESDKKRDKFLEEQRKINEMSKIKIKGYEPNKNSIFYECENMPPISLDKLYKKN